MLGQLDRELRYMLKCIQLYVCDSQRRLKQQHHELVMRQ